MRTVLFFAFCFLGGLAFCQDADSPAVVVRVDSLIKVSRDFTAKGAFDQALEVNAAAEKIALEKFGRESAAYGACCFDRGQIMQARGNYPEAEKWFVESQTIRDKALGKEHPDYAWSLDNLALLYSDQGYHAKAEPLLLEAKAIREKALDKEHPDYARSLDNLGRVYGRMYDFEKAEPFLLEAKAIQEKILGKEHPDYARTLNNLGVLYYLKGEYEKSEPLYLEAKAIREKTLGKEHPDYAMTLHNLGWLYFYGMNELEKAISFFQQAKVIREKVSSKGHPLYASILEDLGYLYSLMGNYEQAEALSLESKAIKEKILGKESLGYAVSLSMLASLYEDIGNYKKSEEFNIEVLSVIEKTFGKEYIGYGAILNNLGVLYMDMGDYEKAEQVLLQSKAIKEKFLSKEDESYAVCLINMGALYQSIGDYEKAEPLYVEGIKTIKKESPRHATCLQSQGNLYFAMGNYPKAESLLLDAKAIREKIHATRHPEYANLLNDLAGLYEAQGKISDSEPLWQVCSELGQSLLLQSALFLSEREIANYSATFLKAANNLNAALLARLKKEGQMGVLPELCFDNTLFRKGFLLGASNHLNALASSTPESKEVNVRLKVCRRRLAAEYAKPIAERDSAQVADLEEKADAIEKELARTVAGYAEAIRQVKWQEVQAALKPGEVAIEFVHFQVNFPNNTDSTLYAALVLRPGDAQPRFIPLFEEKSLDSLLLTQGERRADYVNSLYTLANRSAKPLGKPQKTLYDLLWKPLEKELANASTIYFSPSGLLHRLNLAAIPIGLDSVLGDRHQLVELGSTRQLVIPSVVIPSGNAANDAVLFGGIHYEADSTAMSQANAGLDSVSIASRGELSFSYTDSTLRVGTWNALPYTEREVSGVEKTLKAAGFQTSTRRGHAATEEAFKAMGSSHGVTSSHPVTGSPRVLHLATHGYFFPDPKDTTRHQAFGENEPVFKLSDHPMIRSGLLLAGGNHAWATGKPLRPGMEDGILTAYEISQMNLSNTELVVLSACETGLGDIQGNEGVYGLQRAFKIAGAKYLIMSLWQVPDKQTSLLMTTFYKKWLEDKMEIPEAFRAAQRELREAGLDPYQWAGFVLVE